MPDPRPSPRLKSRTLLLIGLLALAARLAFVALEPEVKRVGDERTWIDWATGCPHGVECPKVAFSPFRTHLIFYPPLYPYLIAALHALTGTLAAVKIAQAFLGAALAMAVARIGALVFGPRAGVGAGVLAALYPELVWFSAHFWSETLFLAFLWWALERLLSADHDGRLGRVAAAGFLWGLAVLVRETVLYLVPVAALWLAWRTGAAGRRRGALFALTALLTVAPWTLRNWITLGAFIPVSTAGGQNLFQGNALIPRDETYLMVNAVQGRVEQYRYAMGMGLQAIRDRQPWWIFEKLRDQMPNFWEADSQVLIHVKRGAYGDVALLPAYVVWAVVGLPYLLVLAGFVIGLLRLPLTRARVFLLVVLVYHNAIHVVTHGFARYRLPAMPVLFLIAAWTFWGAAAPAIPPSRWRRALVGVVALVLAASVVPSIVKNLEHRTFGGHTYPRALGDEPWNESHP